MTTEPVNIDNLLAAMQNDFDATEQAYLSLLLIGKYDEALERKQELELIEYHMDQVAQL